MNKIRIVFFIIMSLLFTSCTKNETINMYNKKTLSKKEIKHLLNRTSFGYSQNDLEKYKNLTKKEAVELLINNTNNDSTLNDFDDIKEISRKPKGFKKLDRKTKRQFRKNMNKRLYDMKVHWYKMMLIHKYSFREKMTLFWHNHFVSEYKVVKNPYFMHKQNQLFRQNALGDFSFLLNSIVKDYAMLVYLDNNSNKKDAPNENFARELMELFTLGVNNYTEEDIKNSARAFTGWRVNKRKFIFKKINKHHDNNEKVFFNQKGNFDGEDIVEIILKNKQTSIFIVNKLYKEFVGNTNNQKLINNIAKEFRDEDYDLSLVLKRILLSDDFWDNDIKIIKSPSEFIISLIKILDINLDESTYKFIVKSSNKQSQILFEPPSVQGWLSDKNWINSYTLVNRLEFVKKLVNKNLKHLSNKEKKQIIKQYSKLEFQLK